MFTVPQENGVPKAATINDVKEYLTNLLDLDGKSKIHHLNENQNDIRVTNFTVSTEHHVDRIRNILNKITGGNISLKEIQNSNHRKATDFVIVMTDTPTNQMIKAIEKNIRSSIAKEAKPVIKDIVERTKYLPANMIDLFLNTINSEVRVAATAEQVQSAPGQNIENTDSVRNNGNANKKQSIAV